ncbi:MULTISPECIES: ABC transporter ATP-binding protein [Streptomyces]|uniref:ATP-binding protein n=1 Tax=Streptomyces pseudovenezuelae TaxID=67350 RepID=A0A101N616_9ACTN|nr:MULTISPECIES: ABC transporter ATP-binding protein [Streptomyces]KUM87191.1 ATP-binding protein [Streptomyces pseudovenezuelae]
MLRCESVSKRYGKGRWILQDVDLEVSGGDVLALVGSNGSGKSTLLRLLVGLSQPTSGRVMGRPRHIGWVPDRFTAHERVSALSYLTHMGRIRGLSGPAARAKAGRLLDRLALVGGRDAALRTLSKGNAQKVALAQALLVEPALLVLDEPWSGLDASAHGVLAEFIAEVSAAGGAVVFTDHREAIAETHATGVHAISDGRVSPRSGPSQGGPVTEVEVVLTVPVTGAVPLEVNWYALPGVTDASRGENAIVLRVAREHSDTALLTALQHHWSVESLTRPGTGHASRSGARRAAL